MGNVYVLLPLPPLLLLFILLLCICFLSLCDWLYPFGFVVSSTSRLYSLSSTKFSLSLLFLTHTHARTQHEQIRIHAHTYNACTSGRQYTQMFIEFLSKQSISLCKCIGALLSTHFHTHAHIGVAVTNTHANFSFVFSFFFLFLHVFRFGVLPTQTCASGSLSIIRHSSVCVTICVRTCVCVCLFRFNGVSCIFYSKVSHISLQIRLTHSLLCGCHVFFSLCVNKVNREGKNRSLFKTNTKKKITKHQNHSQF